MLTRVSLIRDIDIHSPHRAHLDLLQRFSLASFSAESAIRTFADLDTAWQKILSVEELKDSFYKSLAAWFRWARQEIHLAQLPDQTPDTPSNRIFDRYRFTVAENTPLEEDVALDPELLGLVLENLLAEIDPDDEAAAKSARKASGSYYTPRRIVDYMVNEALHLHIRTEFEKNAATPADLQLLGQLCYDLNPNADYTPIAGRVVDVLEAVRVLDPACGSGAFPMGMLHRMVELLRRVDPQAELWKQRLLSRIPAVFRAKIAEEMESQSYNYLRKLGLIQKNLYGLDIQPLATLALLSQPRLAVMPVDSEQFQIIAEELAR